MLYAGVLNDASSSRSEWLVGRLAAAISQPMAGSTGAQGWNASKFYPRPPPLHMRTPQVATGRRNPATLPQVSYCGQGDVSLVSPDRQPPCALARCPSSGSAPGRGG